jgi:hypothetical protein
MNWGLVCIYKDVVVTYFKVLARSSKGPKRLGRVDP